MHFQIKDFLGYKLQKKAHSESSRDYGYVEPKFYFNYLCIDFCYFQNELSRISREGESSARAQGECSSPAPPQVSPDETGGISSLVQPVNATVKSVSEAEQATVASKGATTKQLEPLTLFHLRDALMVNAYA